MFLFKFYNLNFSSFNFYKRNCFSPIILNFIHLNNNKNTINELNDYYGNEYGKLKLKKLRNERKRIIKECKKLEIKKDNERVGSVDNNEIMEDIDKLYNKSKKLANIRQLGRIYLIFKQILEGKEFTPEFEIKIDYFNKLVHYGNKLNPSEVI